MLEKLKNQLLPCLRSVAGICIILLIVAFFLPWVQIGNVPFAPFDVRLKWETLHAAMTFFSKVKPPAPPFYLADFLYIYPVLGLLALFAGGLRRLLPLSLMAAFPWIGVLWVFYKFGAAGLSAITWIGYGVLVISVVALWDSAGWLDGLVNRLRVLLFRKVK